MTSRSLAAGVIEIGTFISTLALAHDPRPVLRGQDCRANMNKTSKLFY
jgi:hypothetical protein